MTPPSSLTFYGVCLAAADSYQDEEVFPSDTLVVRGQDAALVRRHRGWTIIAFRGTDSTDDWRRNFRTSGTNTHQGFLSAATKFSDLVMFYKERGDKVLLTGHSLGGAMADILSRLCVVPCVTFGAPRTTRGAPTVPAAAVRCVASGDPVPHVPLLLMGFRHRTRETLLTKRGVSNRRNVWGFLKALVTGGYVGREAHSIDRYLNVAAAAGTTELHVYETGK